jgi:hypothetical protein
MFQMKIYKNVSFQILKNFAEKNDRGTLRWDSARHFNEVHLSYSLNFASK